MIVKFDNVEDCCCYYSGTAVVSVTPGGDVDVQAVSFSKVECVVGKIRIPLAPTNDADWRKLERYVANQLEYRDSFVERCKLQAQSEAYA